jgi:hypothetical protein
MTPNELISPAEHKLFLGIVFLLCCLFFINLAARTMNHYNWTTEREQIQKRGEANNEPQISFGVNSYKPVFVTIVELQFFTNPLLLLLFLKRGRGRFIFSALPAAFTFYGYADWMLSSYSAIRHGAYFDAEKTTFNTYLLYNSTFLEFISFLLFAVLLVLQIFVLSRFAVGKFQAKIYLR